MTTYMYARYSTDMQRCESIEDQFRVCRRLIAQNGWTEAGHFFDEEESSASLIRPGIQSVLAEIAKGSFDRLLMEDLDRLSRDQEDIAHVYKRCKFAGIEMYTVTDGVITEMHIGLKGTMGALFLRDLAQKTHRGLRGRVENGKSGGGIAFGYDLVAKYDEAGEPIRGDRTINVDQAKVIIRIFEDYLANKSPKAIAHALNREGVPGPTKRGWTQSTINGHKQRGTGILNNELYIGRIVWNRLSYRKHPDTGKRLSKLNPPDQWVIKDVPHLRIIPQDLWDAVKAKQDELKKDTKALYQANRPRYLLSGLLKCGECGGGYSKISSGQYGCSTAKNKGTCKNRLTISQKLIETTVVSSLQDHLMDSELAKAFCVEYTNHMNKLRMERNAQLNAYRKEIERVKADQEKLVDAICDGIPASRVKDRMVALESREKELSDLIGSTKEAPALLHPNMADRYQKEVQDLVAALSDIDKQEEAASLLRNLIDRVVLTPDTSRHKLHIDLHGDLAGILHVAHGANTLSERSALKQQSGSASKKSTKTSAKVTGRKTVKQKQKDPPDMDGSFLALVAGAGSQRDSQFPEMVAGVGFEPTTFRL